MKRLAPLIGHGLVMFCVVTTLSLAIFTVTLWVSGFLTAERLDAAARGLRGETALSPKPEPAKRTAGDASTAREMEELLAMADARERDLKIQAEKFRAEKKAAEKKNGETTPPKAVAEPVKPAGEPAKPETVTISADRFQGNLQILRNHTPKVAAAMMADWEKTESVAYLRAMKPYEAADILAAMLAMQKKGEVDYRKKAQEIQAELGK